MYPDDRVLVVYVPTPKDFAIIQEAGWYRIPQQNAPKGFISEYFAFYFGQAFGSQKWSIHYYAPRLGHELLYRRDLVPSQPAHPRADILYYKIQLGKVIERQRPITSLRWRRLTFLHTTWDRFQEATEINDLLLEGEGYVNRTFTALREKDING